MSRSPFPASAPRKARPLIRSTLPIALAGGKSPIRRGSRRCWNGCSGPRSGERPNERNQIPIAARIFRSSLPPNRPKNMNVLILAAGYATRLYPLTLTKAKPLLEVAGKPMIDWVLDNLAPVPDLERVYVVTNHKFAKDFEAWAETSRQKNTQFQIEIIDNGSTDDSDKLGAIGDICLAISRHNLGKD